MRRSSHDHQDRCLVRRSSVEHLDRYIPGRRSSRLRSLRSSLGGLDVSSPGCGTSISDMTPTTASLDSSGNVFDTPTAGEFYPILNMAASVDTPESFSPMTKKPKRILPSSPTRRMDMPNINQDIFTNTFDWSSRDCIVIALKDNVYSWNHNTNETKVLSDPGMMDFQSGDHEETQASAAGLGEEDGYKPTVTAVAWERNGLVLALGTEHGRLMLYEAGVFLVMGDTCSHSERQVDALAWTNNQNESSLHVAYSCGCMRTICLTLRPRSGQASVNSDKTRPLPDRERISAIKVSADHKYLAYCGDSGNVHTWQLGQVKAGFVIDGHVSKALAFCPWQSTLLASGGGSQGRTIKGHKVSNGAQLFDFDASYEVCSLVWCEATHELISGHAMPPDIPAIQIWSYPTMDLVGSLDGHWDRVIGLAIGPDGCTLASLSIDESLHLWTIAKEKSQLRRGSSLQLMSPIPASPLSACIR